MVHRHRPALPGLVLLWALLLPGVSSARDFDYGALTAHARGLGPVRLGMTLSEASDALDVDIAETGIQYTDADCSSYAFGESVYEWDLRLVARKDKIVKIDIFTPAVTTKAGVGLGSSASEIRQAYDHDIRVLPGRDSGESKLQMKTEADTVLEFVGRSPGPASKDGSGGPAPPEKIRRYSLGLPGTGTSEGCL